MKMDNRQEAPRAGQPNPTMSWERPWDIEEMRRHAGKWSLAADAGILLYLHSFSQELLAHTHNLQEQLNEVSRETKLTGVRINNAFNDFIMLANSQFVENRVYDEDVTVDTVEPSAKNDIQEKTQEQREAELIPKITEALTLGLNVIDTAFERLDVNEANSSSEEDNIAVGSEMLLEPKDLYIHRPLPHLIGSVNFMHDDNVGLADVSSEEEEEEESKESSSESESEKQVAYEKQTEPRANWKQSESESETDEDLFAPGQSKSSEGEGSQSGASESAMENKGVLNVLGELNNKLKTSETKNTTEARQNTHHSSKPKLSHANENDIFCHVQKKFPDDGSDDNDDDPLFKSKSNRFTSAGQLFDNEDDDDDLFSEEHSKGTNKGASCANVDNKKEIAKKEAKTKVTDLFGGDEESDDDLFAIAAKSSIRSTPKKQGGLFTEDAEDKHKEITEKKTSPSATEKKVPAGAVSMFGPGINPMLQSIKQQCTSPTDESMTDSDADSDHNSSSMHDTDTSSSGAADITRAVTKLPSGGQLKKQGIQVLPTPESGTGKKMDNRGPAVKPAASFGGGLFDDDNEDDLFSTSLSKPQSNTDLKSNSKPSSSGHGLTLFADDDGDDDMFGSSIKPTSDIPTTTSSNKKQDKQSSKSVLSLFDDEDDDDIFSPKGGSVGQKKIPLKQNKKTPSKSVFDDEDVLFGLPDEAPTVDLFGTSSPLATNKKASAPSSSKKTPAVGSTNASSQAQKHVTTSVPVTSVAQNKTPDLFLDDNDDLGDLFATGSKSITKKKMEQTSDLKSPQQDGRSLANKEIASKEASDQQRHQTTKQTTNNDPHVSELSAESSGLLSSDKDELFEVKGPAQSAKVKSIFDVDEEEDLFSFTANKAGSTSSLSKPELIEKPQSASGSQKQNVKNTDSSDGQVSRSQAVNTSSSGSSMKSIIPGAVSVFGEMDPTTVLGIKGSSSVKEAASHSKVGLDTEVASKDEGGAYAEVGGPCAVIGFDQPAKASVLPSATKSRARLPATRRRPKRHRTTPSTPAASTEADVSDLFATSLAEGDLNEATAASIPDAVAGETKMHTTKPLDGLDGRGMDQMNRTETMKADSTDDIFADSYDTVEPKPKLVPSVIPSMPAAAKISHPSPVSPSGGPLAEALDASSSSSHAPDGATKSLSADIQPSNDDDIFASSIFNKRSKKDKPSDSDLFGGNKARHKIDDIFAADEEEEDIFGSSSLSSHKVAAPVEDIFSKKQTQVKNTSKSKDFDIFASETIPDEDLFGTNSRTKQNVVSKTQTAEKSSTLLKPAKTDRGLKDDDLFADDSSVRPKTAVTKKPVKTLPDIFDDDDDLFTPKAASSKQEKSSEKKKATNTTKTKQMDDIFSDDIFEDPLLVMKK